MKFGNITFADRSCTVNYYEEFGVAEGASDEDIREAHRTLARLLHPDGQTNDRLRLAAELQMRRINVVAGILLDPRQRREYDRNLHFPVMTASRIPIDERPSDHSGFWVLDSIIAILAALVTALVAILVGVHST